MIVRDAMLKKTEYKGRPTEAAFKDCPCRPCFNAHDCGRHEDQYDPQGNRHTVWKVIMRCATRENGQCVSGRSEPEHTYTVRGRSCKRCGQPRPRGG